MLPEELSWVASIKAQYTIQAERVLDIGSLDVNGNVRAIFTDAVEYVGLDMRPGNNVTIVENGHNVRWWEKDYFDIVVCMSMLEHDDAPWLTIEAINHVIKQNGYLFLSIPDFRFPAHDYPKDYWRFSKDAVIDVLCKGYTILEIRSVRYCYNVLARRN